MSDRTYSLAIKGEQHTYGFEPWAELSYEQLCTILSDLTGYRTTFLAGELPNRFDKLGYAYVEPAIAGGYGGVPQFLIRSSDGRKP